MLYFRWSAVDVDAAQVTFGGSTAVLRASRSKAPPKAAGPAQSAWTAAPRTSAAFLAQREAGGGICMNHLMAAEVTAFVLAAYPGKPTARVRGRLYHQPGLRAATKPMTCDCARDRSRNGRPSAHGK